MWGRGTIIVKGRGGEIVKGEIVKRADFVGGDCEES